MFSMHTRFDAKYLFVFVVIWLLNACTATFFTVEGVTIIAILWFFAFWFLIADRQDKSFFFAYLKIAWPLPFCIVLLCIYYVIGNSQSHVLATMKNVVFIAIFLSMYVYYSRNWDARESKPLIGFWLIDTLISCVYSIYRLQSNPTLARDLATGKDAYYIYYDTGGVISYGVVYGLVLLTPVLLWLVFKKDTKARLFWLLCMAVFVVAIWSAKFVIALILGVISIALLSFIK